jgi:hypothetical protein
MIFSLSLPFREGEGLREREGLPHDKKADYEPSQPTPSLLLSLPLKKREREKTKRSRTFPNVSTLSDQPI